MCSPNVHFALPLDGFADAFPDAPSGVPRGNLCELSVNPFQGNLIVRFQRCNAALRLLDLAHGQLSGYPSFKTLSRCAVEADPYFVLRGFEGVS